MRPPCPAVSTLQLEPDVSTLSLLPVQLLTPESSVSVSALVDSGSSGNFISQALLTRLNLPHKRKPRELRVETIQGKPLGRGTVNYRASPPEVVSRMSARRNHLISGTGGTHGGYHPGSTNILQWSDGILVKSLAGLRPVSRAVCPRFLSTQEILANPSVFHSRRKPEPQVKCTIPSDYQAFQDVFSKQAATRLPPHRPWDCAIDLLPEAKLPKGRVYPLSITERKAMEDYIKEALQQGFIWPSTSPAASSFLLRGQKRTEACGHALITEP